MRQAVLSIGIWYFEFEIYSLFGDWGLEFSTRAAEDV